MHLEKHSKAGQWVKIKPSVKHFQYEDFGGSEIRIEDWWDNLSGKSWEVSTGVPGCMVYAIRLASESTIPRDDEVIYGHRKDGFGSLVHVTEIEL